MLKKSFTLIELLIVVAIIGILAGIGVPMYNNYIQNAKIATVQSNFDEFVKFMQIQMVNCETSNTIQLNKGNGLQAVQCPNDAWEMAWSLTSHFQNEGWMTAYPQEWYAKWSPYAVHVSNDPGGKKLCRTVFLLRESSQSAPAFLFVANFVIRFSFRLVTPIVSL